MKITYYPETDSMYIDLSAKESVESAEISPGVVIDYDSEFRTLKVPAVDSDLVSCRCFTARNIY